MTDDFDIICPNCGTINRSEARMCSNCGYNLSAERPEPVAVSEGATGADAQLSQDITEITDPLLRMGFAGTRDMIGATLERILADVGPRQAEVLRRCAIPRWFDANVLAVLRERVDGNDRVLDLLRGYSFVRPLDDDRYAYHDEVRETLLNEWHRQRELELRSWHQRLADYFRERAARAMPARALPKGPTSTTISVAVSGDWDLFQREALYHTLLFDQQAGLTALGEAFEQAEMAHRLGDAEALLQITRNVPMDEAGRLWVRYMRARLDRAALRLETAEHQLVAILSAPGLGRLLEARTEQTLGEIYAETARWVEATERYQRARAIYETDGQQHDAAETWRLLGEAYQELGTSTGGWHVPAYPQNRWLRALGQLWVVLLSLPFYVMRLFFRSPGALLPHPLRLASYRNWTLIWLYRTAASCYQRARITFEQLGDDTGMLRAERQLADIRRIFGYPQQALQQVEQMKTRPAARDPYQRAWVDWVRAAALIDLGDTAQALTLINAIVALFREVGDIRREAAALALRGRAAAQAGDYDAALATYKECLDRFRALNYAAVRELVLYDLRALRRQVGPGQISQQVRAMLEAEQVKRYVARFPRSQLPLLRILSVAALPLALLVLAIVAPEESIAQVAQLVSFQTVVDFSRGLLAVLALLALYSGVYALVATGVIVFVRMGDLSREQPDYFVTDPQGISRYDFRGARAQFIDWDEVGRWLRIERCLWMRPVSLVSGTYLESRAGQDMRIDGITGWYPDLQEDIEYHLRLAKSSVQSENFGFNVIRSKSGVSVIAGLVLLVMFIFSQNSWSQWMVALLPPQLYAALSLVVFSGLLILIPAAYWMAINPLSFRQALGIRDYYPFAGAGAGVVAMLVGSLGMVPRIPALNFGLVIAGGLVLGYALAVLIGRSHRRMRALAVAVPLIGALVYVGWNVLPTFHLIVTRVGADQAVLSASEPGAVRGAQASVSAASEIINDPTASLQDRAQAYANAGRALYAQGNYDAAFEAYTRALEIYDTLPEGQTKRQAQASVLYNRYKARKDSGGQGWSQDLQASCALVPDVGPDCVQRNG